MDGGAQAPSTSQDGVGGSAIQEGADPLGAEQGTSSELGWGEAPPDEVPVEDPVETSADEDGEDGDEAETSDESSEDESSGQSEGSEGEQP